MFGTFVLVFGGCGAAVFAAKVVGDDGFIMGIGFLGVALAFGLTVVVMAYAVGHISGGHFNPAVTLGCVLAGRTPMRDAVPYWITQLIAGIVAGGLVLLVATGNPDYSLAQDGLATNGYGEFSPNGFSLVSVLIVEFVLTAIFLFVILGTTDDRSPVGMSPLWPDCCTTSSSPRPSRCRSPRAAESQANGGLAMTPGQLASSCPPWSSPVRPSPAK